MRAPALALGADRYLEKGEPLDVIREAVREVALAA
jgi:DNA-binding NarL/FixJ family response regulator